MIVVVVLIAAPAVLLGPRLLKDDGDGADAPEKVGAVERSVRSWIRDRAQAMLDPRGLPAWEEPNFKGPPCDPVTLFSISDEGNEETAWIACEQMLKIQADYPPECPPDGGCEISLQARAELEGVLHLLDIMGGEDEPSPGTPAPP